jgi:hypothetical protein
MCSTIRILDVDLGQFYLPILTVMELNQECLIVVHITLILDPAIQEMPE